MTYRDTIQALAKAVGYEVTKVSLGDAAKLKLMLSVHEVDTVLDVGANIGQFASSLRRVGFTGRIISFEPQLDAYLQLVSTASADPNWDVAIRGAVGAIPGELNINISHNSVSSSALEILDAHIASAPASRFVRTETVPVLTLDTSEVVPKSGRIFLKIDTQGFEQQVLDGATELLSRVVGVQTELSLAPLYAGQADFIAIFSQMRALGFDTWAINPGFNNRDTGRLLQADATFFRARA